MVLDLTEGIGSAKQANARTNASTLLTGEIGSAIRVRSALTLNGARFQDAFSFVGVSAQSHWTDTLVAALLVDAVSSISTRGMSTLVIVDATLQRIPCVTSLAHTLRRIRRCTLGIDTARESLAGI